MEKKERNACIVNGGWSKKTINQFVLATELVNEFFDDYEKTLLWMVTPNINLGELSPIQMIVVGRYKKLKQFIKNRLEDGGKNDTKPRMLVLR